MHRGRYTLLAFLGVGAVALCSARRLAAAGTLTGPRRYLAYGKLDAQLARDAAPWIAYGNRPHVDYLSSRIGCRVYQPVYGIDLASLCVRRHR